MFDEKIDVHGYDKNLELQFRLLEETNLLHENRQAIKDFANHCIVDPKVNAARIIKYIYSLRRIGILVNKPFKEMNEKDINEMLAKLQEAKTIKCRPYSTESMDDFRKAISKFWRWLYYDEYFGDSPPPIKRVRTRTPKGSKEPEVYSKEEIRKIICGMTNIRDKAFFSCLYDLQCRVSELLSRQVKHIRYTDYGDIQILVEADKTGKSHWETLFESVSDFTTWFRNHPDSASPNAPLWVMQKKKAILPVKYASIRKAFIVCCKRQNIKRLKVHTFRKSKATHDLADGVPLTYIESRGSWSKGSRALQDCYLAVMQKDKDDAYKKKYNISTNANKIESTELKRCYRCNSIVENDCNFCARCGTPTNKQIVKEAIELEKKLPEMIDKDMLSELVKKIILEEIKKNT